MNDDLLDMLRALDGVRQDPRYHPEGDALYHSLQAFDLARRATPDRAMWLAALLHDVGKVFGSPDHDRDGADLLDGLVAPRVVWLIRHHLDLLREPAAARRRWRGTGALVDLEALRRFDVGGRRVDATVLAPGHALELALAGPGASLLLAPGGPSAPPDEHDPRLDFQLRYDDEP